MWRSENPFYDCAADLVHLQHICLGPCHVATKMESHRHSHFPLSTAGGENR